jgi:hypothetical protein
VYAGDEREKKPNMDSLRQRIPGLYRISVPGAHWDDLKRQDIDTLCDRSLGRPHPEGMILSVFKEDMLVDVNNACFRWSGTEESEPVDCPLLELMTLVYLLNVSPEPLSHDMISVSELKDAHFFQGPHALRTGSLIKHYGDDVRGFRAAAERLGGKPVDMADASFRFMPFPRIPMYYLLWEGDEEFGPNLSVLFDRSIEKHLNADGIWGIVGLISDLLANNLSPRDL